MKDEARQYMINRIESLVGTLASVPWDQVSLEDLEKLLGELETLQEYRLED